MGTIHVSGAKNSALPSMAAAILTTEDVVLENIPQVRDIDTERKLLAAMGAEVELWDDGTTRRTRINCATLPEPVAKYEIVKTMRASSLVLGPLVARFGVAFSKTTGYPRSRPCAMKRRTSASGSIPTPRSPIQAGIKCQIITTSLRPLHPL